MNVWGKRTFESAFPSDVEFNTVIADTSVETPVLKAPGGGPVHIEGGFNVTGGDANVADTLSAGAVETDVIGPHAGDSLSIDVGPAGQVHSDDVLTLDAPNNYVNFQTRAVLIQNNAPLLAQVFSNVGTAVYNPCGPDPVSAFPEVEFHFGWGDGWDQRAQWGWEYEFGGVFQTQATSSNSLLIYVFGGPVGTTSYFSVAGNPCNNANITPIDCGYVCKINFMILTTGAGGTARGNVTISSSRQGSNGLPVVYTTYCQDFAYDTTVQQVFDVKMKTSDATTNLSVLWGKGNQMG
jgi:hypothetical protein